MRNKSIRKGVRWQGSRATAGFSLIELLIVVAIILIICAIAIPNYMHSRMVANEAATVSNMRNITTAETCYTQTYGVGYSQSLGYLGGAGTGATAAGLIDDVLASGVKSGFSFTYAPQTPDTNGYFLGFTVKTSPSTFGTTGQRYFFVDQSGVIRQNLSATATAADNPI